MGLLGCNETPDGPICGYSSFNDTKTLVETTWSVTDNVLTVAGLGSIKKSEMIILFPGSGSN